METLPEQRDAAVTVARDTAGLVAVLTSRTARHGELFLPGGRLGSGETPMEGARRELREEAGITAESWTELGTYAITLGSPARMSLFLAENLTLGHQQLAEGEEDF